MTHLLPRPVIERLAIYAGHLFALCGLAVAQPLFDVLGPNPTFFAARTASASQIVLVALLIVFAPPAVLLLAVAAAQLADARVGNLLQTVLVGALVAVIAVQALRKAFEDATWTVLAVAVAAGALGAVAYRRAPVARRFLTALIPAPLVFLGLFLFHSPTSQLVTSPSARVELADVRPGPPVTIIIFDEFSSGTLMDARGRIDAARFPNFARLAHDATWYRNATTVDPWTEHAVPALLTGRLPDSDSPPTFEAYPHNIYTLLGRSYTMNDHETLTRLCPEELCNKRTATPVPSDTSTLLSDTSVVFEHLVLPGRLERNLPSLDARWGDFRGTGSRPAAPGADKPTPDPTAVYDDFVASLRPSRQPTLSVVHIGLPHVPWQFFPSGRRYLLRFEGVAGLNGDETWGPDRWLVLQGYQRHLLQTGYVDRLLGELVRRLRRTGLYDRTLLVVTADHGVSFNPNGGRRAITASSVGDIAFPPMFVKAPRQRRGRIVDAGVRTIDIVPTIASLLGVRIPWHVDGRPAPNAPLRSGTVVSIEGKRYRLRDLLREREKSIARQIALFGTRGWNRLLNVTPSHRELLGRRVIDLPIATTSRRATLEDGDRFADVDLRGPFSPGYVTGAVSGREARAGEPVAVAVNGRIRALTQTYDFAGRTRFAALVPDSAFRQGPNRVTLYAISGGEQGVVLGFLAETSGERFTLVEGAAGPTAIKTSRPRRLIEITPGAVAGRVDVAVVQGSVVRLAGWAVAYPSGRAHDRLVLFADGRLIASSASGVDRPDLGPWSHGSGFDFLVPLDSLTGQSARPRLQLLAVAGRTASELPIRRLRLPR